MVGRSGRRMTEDRGRQKIRESRTGVGGYRGLRERHEK